MIGKKILQAGLWAMATGVGILASGGAASGAGVNMYDGQWHYSLTPYAWFPNVYQNLHYTGPLGATNSADIKVEPSNYLSDLKFALMGIFEARKGNWALAMDVVYSDFGTQTGKIETVRGPRDFVSLPINANANVDIQSLILTGIGSYTAAQGSAGTLDVLGGVRYLGLDVSTDLSFSGPYGALQRARGTSDTIDVWDGIVGVRGALRLGAGDDWFLPYYLDIGAGNYSNWTWQGWAGIGYRFHWGDLVLVYRNLYYTTTSNNELLQDLRLAGPALGVTFRW